MSGDFVTTRLDAPYAQQPATRAAAARVLERLGATDLLEILGLVEPKPEPVPEPKRCSRGHVLPSHGICRRSEDCRIDARKAGGEA